MQKKCLGSMGHRTVTSVTRRSWDVDESCTHTRTAYQRYPPDRLSHGSICCREDHPETMADPEVENEIEDRLSRCACHMASTEDSHDSTDIESWFANSTRDVWEQRIETTWIDWEPKPAATTDKKSDISAKTVRKRDRKPCEEITPTTCGCLLKYENGSTIDVEMKKNHPINSDPDMSPQTDSNFDACACASNPHFFVCGASVFNVECSNTRATGWN